MLVQKTREKQSKATAESRNSSNSSRSNCIGSFTPSYYQRTCTDLFVIILARVKLKSIDRLKHNLSIHSMKLLSKRDRNLKKISAPAVPHAHLKNERKRGSALNAFISDAVYVRSAF